MKSLPPMLRYFHPVAPSRLLKKRPLRVELADRPFAIFRTAEGRPAALVDVCPHRFTPLSLGHVRPDGRLACPYHGWHFSGEGRGINPSQPNLSICDVESLQAAERYGYVWIADRHAAAAGIPDVEVDGFELIDSYVVRFDAPVHVLLANISDVEHVSYLHSLGIGSLKRVVTFGKVESCIEGDSISTRYSCELHASGLGLLAQRFTSKIVIDGYTRFDPLRITWNISSVSPGGDAPGPIEGRVLSFLVPETRNRTVLYGFVMLRICAAWLKPIKPLLSMAWLKLAQLATRQDARFLARIADTPLETKGMRLDRFDKPVVDHLRTLYRTPYAPKAWSDHVLDEADAAMAEPHVLTKAL